jgi:hypothetical protein
VCRGAPTIERLFDVPSWRPAQHRLVAVERVLDLAIEAVLPGCSGTGRGDPTETVRKTGLESPGAASLQ